MDRYGKLENGVLINAPKGVELEGGAWQIPPSAEWLTANGYKVVKETPMPEPKPHYAYSFTWEETEKHFIVQIWHEEYIEPEYTEEDRLTALEEAFEELAGIVLGGEL